MKQDSFSTITRIFVGLGVLVLVGVSIFAGWMVFVTKSDFVSSFEECAVLGYPIMESYPRQCRTPSGKTFVEAPGQQNDQVRVFLPAGNAVVASPLIVRGEARGRWYFEASFPVRLLDGNGREIAVQPAQAQGEWMTEEFVPFEVTLTFATPTTALGTLVLEKDNPSGLPEYAEDVRLPIQFADVQNEAPSSGDGECIVTGCSSQVCADEEVITTCEFRPEFACFTQAVCERQPTGQCGWTPTDTLRACLEARNVRTDSVEPLY